MWIKTVVQQHSVGWWTTNTPAGAATVAFRQVSGEVLADAWGTGAEWAISQVPSLLGNADDPSGFCPLHTVVRDLTARFGVPRLGATDRWYEALATAAVHQRVVDADARSSVLRLGRMFGEKAPGNGPLPLFPAPGAALRIPDHDFHRAGVDRARARVVRVAAKYADRLEALSEQPPAQARRWLQRLPGVGPWTAARASAAAAGDPDAVPVGDLHLPRLVTFAFTGASDGTDASMLELLEPYAGHRARVIRQIEAAGLGPARHFPAPTRYDISRI